MTPSLAGISRFVNKTVHFQFKGRVLRFALSHALFSSFDIDAGSRLLLKTLAGTVDLASLRSALDIGCGVGVIGACVSAHSLEARVVMQDRDSLAAAFTLANCRDNGLGQVSVTSNLAFHGLGEEAFDLVTSNLPAKAGKPVLLALLRHAAGSLLPGGMAGIVVVAPLAQFVRESLAAMECAVAYCEESAGYAVYHFRAGSVARETASQREDISPYIRSITRFDSEGFQYALQTAHSLPDFDVVGYPVQLALGLARGITASGRLLSWNPGQGHIPVALLTRAARGTSVTVASRDVLQCSISALNLAALGVIPESAQPVCSEADLATSFAAGSFDMLTAAPQPIPRVPWQIDLAGSAARLLRPGGRLLLTCTSTEMRRFLDLDHGFRMEDSRKHAGFRAAMFRRP